jgi:hypothetical protein
MMNRATDNLQEGTCPFDVKDTQSSLEPTTSSYFYIGLGSIIEHVAILVRNEDCYDLLNA